MVQIDGGSDLLLVETCQDLLQTKAALAAIFDQFKGSKIRIPVIAQVTIETFGTMLNGTEISAALTALDSAVNTVNTALGDIGAAIQEYAGRQCTIAPSFANDMRSEAARLLAELAPGDLNKVFFTNGGADANENAIRMARLHTGRDKVVSTYRSYHGNTGAAIVSTGDWRRLPNEYARGHVHVFGPYLYRSEFWSTSPEEVCERLRPSRTPTTTSASSRCRMSFIRNTSSGGSCKSAAMTAKRLPLADLRSCRADTTPAILATKGPSCTLSATSS